MEGKTQSPPVAAPLEIPGVSNRISRSSRNAYALECNAQKFLSPVDLIFQSEYSYLSAISQVLIEL